MQLLVWILLFSQLAFSGAGKIEESYYVHSQSSSLKRSIIQHPELILDHPSSRGFELYGPAGLGQYLKNLGVKFESLEKIEKLKNTKTLDSYPSYEMVVKRLQAAVSKYSSIMKLFSVGKTVEGRDLWVVKISKNVNVDEVEPEFKYIANMHGDEIVGRELMQNLIEDLGRSYAAGERAVVDLVNHAEVFIMPSMNPDGAEAPQRGNGNDVDLNRNFPDETMNPRSPQSSSAGWGRGFPRCR